MGSRGTRCPGARTDVPQAPHVVVLGAAGGFRVWDSESR